MSKRDFARLQGLPNELLLTILGWLSPDDLPSILRVKALGQVLDVTTIASMFEREFDVLEECDYKAAGRMLWKLLFACKLVVAKKEDPTILVKTTWQALKNEYLTEILIPPVVRWARLRSESAEEKQNKVALLQWAWKHCDLSPIKANRPTRNRPATLLLVGRLLRDLLGTIDPAVEEELKQLENDHFKSYVIAFERSTRKPKKPILHRPSTSIGPISGERLDVITIGRGRPRRTTVCLREPIRDGMMIMKDMILVEVGNVPRPLQHSEPAVLSDIANLRARMLAYRAAAIASIDGRMDDEERCQLLEADTAH